MPNKEYSDKMKGIPSADQEALQAPQIDPVLFAAMVPTMGPAIAAKNLFGQIIQDHIFSALGEAFNRKSQYVPATVPANFGKGLNNSVERLLAQNVPIPKTYGDNLRAWRHLSQGRDPYAGPPLGGPYADNLGDRIVGHIANASDKLFGRFSYEVDPESPSSRRPPMSDDDMDKYIDEIMQSHKEESENILKNADIEAKSHETASDEWLSDEEWAKRMGYSEKEMPDVLKQLKNPPQVSDEHLEELLSRPKGRKLYSGILKNLIGLGEDIE